MSSSLRRVLTSDSPLIKELLSERPKLPTIKCVEREDQPKFDGPFTLTVLDKSRIIRGRRPLRDWSYEMDGEWDNCDHDKLRIDYKFLYYGHETPMLPEYREGIEDHIYQFGDDEYGPRSRYDPEGLCCGIKNELNRLWTTMGPLKFLSQYYVRLLEIPCVLTDYQPLIRRVLKDRADAMGRVNFIMFRHSKAKGALETPEEVLDLIARFLGVL